MMNAKSLRWGFALLVISLSVNILFVSFLSTAAQALIDPQEAIEGRVEKILGDLPDKYRAAAQGRYDQFHAQYIPVLGELKKERKTFIQLLLASPVDIKATKVSAEKLRALTAKLQEGMQDTVIDITANLPADEKAKIVDNSRVLKMVLQQ